MVKTKSSRIGMSDRVFNIIVTTIVTVFIHDGYARMIAYGNPIWND